MNPKGLFFKVIVQFSVNIYRTNGVWVVKRTVPLTLVMLYLWKAFDIVCLDWLLLTKSHFFQHFYPETEGCAGYRSFGFNRKGQLIRIAVFPFAAAALSGICMLFC